MEGFCSRSRLGEKTCGLGRCFKYIGEYVLV